MRIQPVSIILFLPMAAVAQTTTWTEFENPWASFEDRLGHTMASNVQAGVLMFGGESLRNPGVLLGDTSALNSGNTQWASLTPALSPSSRRGHAMVTAWSQGQPVFIVFGGLAQVGPVQQQVADTWTNTGGGWSPLVSNQSPLARSGHAMVTDFARNGVYLVGGLTGSQLRNDVYHYDPNTSVWTLRLPNGASPFVPPQRRNHCLAYDPGLDRVILFGGQGLAGSLDDTWAYDPVSNTWASVHPPVVPPARIEAAMSYLLGFGIVMFGGRNPTLPAGQQVLGDTWVFQGGNWTLPANLSVSPSPRFGHAMAPDQLAQNIIVVGGSDVGGAPIPGTWLWNGVRWVERLPAPSPRDGAAMAFDVISSSHLAFGGRRTSNQSDLDELWDFDGAAWTERPALPAPSARRDAGMSYNSYLGRMLLYGGRSGASSELGDTWEWGGSSWSLRTFGSNPTPPAAGGTQPVFDSSRRLTWMFVNGTMWAYDGSTWAMWHPGGTIPALTNYGAAYDSRRDRVVVFGGMTSDDPQTAAFSDQTWEWDGVAWLRRNPTISPVPRGRSRMCYDEARSRVVLFGGINSQNNILGDTWEWDGTSWFSVSPASQPPASSAHGISYDSARRSSVLLGGAGTWKFGPLAPAEATPFPATWPTPGTGACTTTAGPMRLLPLPWSGPWLGDRFEVDFENRPAGALGMLLWAFSNTTWYGVPLPLPLAALNVQSPCDLLVDPFVTELVLAPRYQSFVLPTDPILLSTPMFVQAGFFDTTPQGTQIITTNGLALTFGQK